MFFESASFSDQPPEGATVWRYMDLARFLSVIDSGELHFTQAALMKDKWEGTYGAKAEDEDGFIAHIRSHPLSPSMYLNCWHLSEYESAAMWEIYQRDGRGIAIKTTWGDLKASILGSQSITGGRVHYVDYDKLDMNDTNAFSPFVYKRLSFEHENEVRLAHWSTADVKIAPSAGIDAEVGRIARDAGSGVPVRVNLDMAIKQVFIAPDAEPWVLPLIQRLTKKYGLKAPVIQSNLYSGPIS
jgi:hypothetical protein